MYTKLKIFDRIEIWEGIEKKVAWNKVTYFSKMDLYSFKALKNNRIIRTIASDTGENWSEGSNKMG